MTAALEHQVFVFRIRQLRQELLAFLLSRDLLQHRLEKLSPGKFLGLLLERYDLEELDRIDAPPGEYKQASEDLSLALLDLLLDLII